MKKTPIFKLQKFKKLKMKTKRKTLETLLKIKHISKVVQL